MLALDDGHAAALAGGVGHQVLDHEAATHLDEADDEGEKDGGHHGELHGRRGAAESAEVVVGTAPFASGSAAGIGNEVSFHLPSRPEVFYRSGRRVTRRKDQGDSDLLHYLGHDQAGGHANSASGSCHRRGAGRPAPRSPCIMMAGPRPVETSRSRSHASLPAMGSIPRKRHIAHRHEPGYRGEGIYYEEVVTTAGFGRAYSIVYHLRPPTRVRKVEAAGDVAARDRRAAGAAAPSPQDPARMQPAGDPDHRPRAAAGQRRRDPGRCRPGPAAGRAVPQRRRRRGAVRPQGPRHAAHACSASLPFRPFDYIVIPRCTTYRLEFDAGSAARPAGHRGGRQRRHPAALPQPRRPAPARRSLLRARPARPARDRWSSTASRTRPSSSRTAGG